MVPTARSAMEYISHMGYPVKEEGVVGNSSKQGEDANIVGAEVPDALIPHSYVSESVAAHAMYQKCVNAVPLGRWIKICSDETRVQVLKEPEQISMPWNS